MSIIVSYAGIFSKNIEDLMEMYCMHKEGPELYLVEKSDKFNFKASDVICKTNKGRVMFLVEIVWKTDYNTFQWLKLLLSAILGNIKNNSNHTAFKLNRENMEFISMDLNWYEQIKKQL